MCCEGLLVGNFSGLGLGVGYEWWWGVGFWNSGSGFESFGNGWRWTCLMFE